MRGKIVVITGGFGALATSVARAASVEGAQIALIDISQRHGEPMPDAFEQGGVDIAVPEQAQAALDAVVAHFGRLDILINIAGGFRWQTLEDGDLSAWPQLYAMNVLSAASASKVALAHMRAARGGRIINIGAGAAVKATAGMGAYAAAKAGVHRLTESLAEETKGAAITVNAILPSIIDTHANRADMPDADFSSWVTAEEIASVVLFLASDAASGVTGALIAVSGRV